MSCTGGNEQKQTMSELSKGDKIPYFTLKDKTGADFSIEKLIGKEHMVIYFYPKDDTPGCTKEACSFRDSFEAFSDKGVRVIGISSDSPASHKKFAEKHNLPFTLLSDPANRVRKMFGVKGNLFGLIPGRVTFVVHKDGTVLHKFSSQMNAEQHVQESLQTIESL
jgi:peroxiredoxin Q/BCP